MRVLLSRAGLVAPSSSGGVGIEVERAWSAECVEFWLTKAGQIPYPIEGQGVIIADEGDVVYAPRFHGPGHSCRLAIDGYTNICDVCEAQVPY